MVSYFFNLFAISNLVPTPSVAETKTGFLQLYGCRSNKEPKPPIFLNPLIVDPLIFVLFERFDIYFTKLFVFDVSTPLFLYVNFFLCI